LPLKVTVAVLLYCTVAFGGDMGNFTQILLV